MMQIGEKILKLIYDMNFDSHPLIFHVFSNGGAFLYQHISTALKHTTKPVQICGMIFDSAPGNRRFFGLYKALSMILGKERRWSWFLSVLLTITTLILWLAEDSFNLLKNLVFPSGFDVQINPVYNLKNERVEWPQLFLYSKEDQLVPYKVRLGIIILFKILSKTCKKKYSKNSYSFIYFF